MNKPKLNTFFQANKSNSLHFSQRIRLHLYTFSAASSNLRFTIEVQKIRAIQNNKKGDLSLPTVNYFCIAMKKQLTEAQRYEIYLDLNKKWSLTHIAREIEVSKSTVSREIRRNAKTDGSYV